jgi:hypothetical protein
MEQLQTLAIALGLSSLVGLRLYLTVFLTSLALNQGWLKLNSTFESLGILGSDAVLIASAVLLVLEFMADKVQGFDSVWDSIHTFIRPIGATILALQVLGDWPPEAKVVAALCAGAVALTVHSAKAGTRLIVNTSPEPFSNLALSTAEDLAVAGMFTLLITNPLLGGAVLMVGVGFCAWFTPKAFRMAKATTHLLWQRLTRHTGVPAHASLPRQLSADHDMLVGEAVGHDADVDWAVETISSRTRGFRGLDNNRFGLLVATSSQPDTLVFLAKKLFGRAAVRLPLAGCQFVRQSTFLSENLVIYHRESKRRTVFRFAKAEEAIATRLVEELRQRTGAPSPAAQAPAATLPDRLKSPSLTSGMN